MELQRFENEDYTAIEGWFACEAVRKGLGDERVLWAASKARSDDPDNQFIYAGWHDGERVSVVMVWHEFPRCIGLSLARDPQRSGHTIGSSTIGEATIAAVLALTEFASTEVVIGFIRPGNVWSEDLADRLKARRVPQLDRNKSQAYAARVDRAPLPDDWP